ncbi:hypothetical protein ACHAXS_003935 [Conticribra weissflogii]
MPPKKRPSRDDETGDEDSETPPKPKRPLTAYNIFSQLERNYILQSEKDDPPVLPTSVDDDTSRRPEKYRNVIMPKNWFKVGKIKPKRRERENHGKISFLELTKAIAKGWNEADSEVKQYCRDVAGKELERYREAMADFTKKYGNNNEKNAKKEIETEQRKRHKSKQGNKKAKDGVSQGSNDAASEERSESSDYDRKLPALRNNCECASTTNTTTTTTSATATANEQNEDYSYSNFLCNSNYSLHTASYHEIPQFPPMYPSINEIVCCPPRAEISASSFRNGESSTNTARGEIRGIEAEGEPLPYSPLSLNANVPPDNSSSSAYDGNPYPVDQEVSEFLSRILNEEDGNSSPFSSGHSISTTDDNEVSENEEENESMHLAYNYFTFARSQNRNSDSSSD